MPSITTNQVMGDGIMALFGAPLAHEDHAVRACYAALLWHSSARTGGQVQRRIFLRRAWRGLCVTSSVEHGGSPALRSVADRPGPAHALDIALPGLHRGARVVDWTTQVIDLIALINPISENKPPG